MEHRLYLEIVSKYVRCPAERLEYAEQTKIAAMNCGITSAAAAVGLMLWYMWIYVYGAPEWGTGADGKPLPVPLWYFIKIPLVLLLVIGQLATFGITVEAYKKATTNYGTKENDDAMEKVTGSEIYSLFMGLGFCLVGLGVIFPLFLVMDGDAKWVSFLCPLAGMAIAFVIAGRPAEDIMQFDPNHKINDGGKKNGTICADIAAER
jgi:hypothetical protein